MAPPSPRMLFCEEASSLTPEECLRLRQWMFSTDYYEAAVTGENRAKSQFLLGIDMGPEHVKKATTRSKGEGIEATATRSELLLDLHHNFDAADLDLVTSREAVITSLLASSVATETCNEAAVAADVPPVSGVTVFKGGSDATSYKEAVVASILTETRKGGGAQNCREATSAIRNGQAAAGSMRRKRVRKQQGLLPSFNKICERPISDIRFRIPPLEKRFRSPSSSAAHATTLAEFADSLQLPATASFKAQAGTTHGATATATDCSSEVIEEKGGSMKVIVRKGNVSIIKRFSPADTCDRLPDLMFHLEKLCPLNYSERSATTDGSLAVPTTLGDVAVAAPPGNIQDGAYHVGRAKRANCMANVGSGTPKAFCVAPNSSGKMANSSEDRCSKRLMTDNDIAKQNTSETPGTLGATGRVKAGAQLYRDWVSKHFDQVHHYLSCSKSYLQPDARSRERAASLALHMLLNLPQDTQQQSYLQWITTFLNASSSSVNANIHLTNKNRSPTQQEESAYSLHTAAASARASSTNSPWPTSYCTPPRSAPCCSSSSNGTAIRAPSARVSPRSVVTPPSSIKSREINEAPQSDAVNRSSGVNPFVPRLSSNASNITAVTAQLLDCLCLLDPTECTSRRADLAPLASRHRHTDKLPSVSPVTIVSQGNLVSTGEKATAREKRRNPHQRDEDRSSVQLQADSPTDITATAVATLPQPRDTTGQAAAAAAAENFAGAAAGTATPFELPTVVTAAPLTATTSTDGSSASVRIETVSLARAGVPLKPHGRQANTADLRAAILATAAGFFSGATGKTTRRAKSKAETPISVADTEAGVAVEGSVCTTPEIRATNPAETRAVTAVESPKSAGRWCAGSVAHTTSGAEKSKALGEIRDTIPDVVAEAEAADAATTLAHGPAGPSSANACEVIPDSERAQMEFERSNKSLKGVMGEHRSYDCPTQVDCDDVSSGKALSDEVIEAAGLFVDSFSHEKGAATWIDHRDFLGVLQMLQTALDKPAGDGSQQDVQHTQQQSVLQYEQQTKGRQGCQEEAEGQHRLNRIQPLQHEKASPVEQHTRERNDGVKQEEEKNYLSHRQQEGNEQLMKQQLLQKVLSGVHPQQQQFDEYGQRQQGGICMEVDDHILGVRKHCAQQDRDQLVQASGISAMLEQGQQQAQEQPEQQTGVSPVNSICSLLYSLLQKRLPPGSETPVNQESVLLQETSLDCSSQDSRNVSSRTEDFLIQAMNSFTTKECCSEFSDRTSQTTQSVWHSTEDAASLAFPCYLDERTADVEANCSSFCSRSSSSTSACSSTGLGNTYWPSCNSIGHPEQQHDLAHEGAAPPPEGDFSLPVEETSHRSADTEIFSNHATAAAVG